MKLIEFCRGRLCLGFSLKFSLFLNNLYNTFVGHGEELLIEELIVMDDFEVVRSELGASYLGSVAIQKLDGHTGTVLGKESDSCGSVPNFLLKMPDWRVLLNEIGFTKFIILVVF